MPGRPLGLGLVTLLLSAVLVPSTGLLWFMTQALKGERAAAQQKLLEAYRAHLAVAQERLEGRIERNSSDLENALQQHGPAAAFELAISSNLADGAVVFDGVGTIVYPQASGPPSLEHVAPEWSEAQRIESSDPTAAARAFGEIGDQTTNITTAARARQAEIRCFVEARQTEIALKAMGSFFAEKRFERERDRQSRLIVADLELLAIQMLGQGSNLDAPPKRTEIKERLRRRLSDYSEDSMPSSQRRFLMRELMDAFPREIKFPTLPAEDFAARFVEAGAARPGEQTTLRQSSISRVWQQGAARGRMILLHRAENVERRISSWVPSQGLPSDVRFKLIAPGQPPGELLVPVSAAAALPAWRMGLVLRDKNLFRAAANERVATYLWMGALVFGTVILLAALVLRLVRKQVTLTQLKNDLVANVTHELKTPLSSMRLLVDTLLNNSKLDEKTTREYLQMIAAENVRLSRLIDNFLTFSRIERNKYAFNFKDVPAERIVEQSAAAVRERFSGPDCDFEVLTPSRLPAVSADEDAMVTVLVNLLDNAYKYSGEQKRISLSAAAENGSVRFTIKDNGIGLSPRETNRIFKRFYQVDQRMTRKGGGCGLGLSIVKFIVNAHHGEIEVQSEPGKGSEFIVEIPAGSSGGSETEI